MKYAIEEEADFVVVGSGAAGATAARWLSSAGHSVVILEEGEHPARVKGAREALSKLYRDAGASAAIGPDVLPILQGRCVGGTTVINGAIQVPFPEPVWREWVTRDPAWAQRLPWVELQNARTQMEAELSVSLTSPKLWGGSGGAMKDALHLHATPTRRNTIGCKGSGRCLEGCPNSAKQSADRTLIPKALQNGARLHTGCTVRKVLIKGGRAMGVVGRLRNGQRLRAQARRAVFLAAGAIQTSALLSASGVRDAGRNFSCHPGAAIAGLFPSERTFGPEATQSMESTTDLSQRLKFESLGMPKALLAARVPGIGAELSERLSNINRVALWGVAVRAKAIGLVKRGPFGPLVFYTLTREDRARILLGLSKLAAGMLEAGAEEVWPSVFGAPQSIRSLKQAHAIKSISPNPGVVPLVATHLFGGAQVGDRFEANDIPGLVVADSALFPTNLGVNPMSSITAIATLIAKRWS